MAAENRHDIMDGLSVAKAEKGAVRLPVPATSTGISWGENSYEGETFAEMSPTEISPTPQAPEIPPKEVKISMKPSLLERAASRLSRLPQKVADRFHSDERFAAALENQRFSFPDVDKSEAVDFVLAGEPLTLYSQGCFLCATCTSKSSTHQFWVDEQSGVYILQWTEGEETTARPENRVFLSDIHHVSAYVLDGQTNHHHPNHQLHGGSMSAAAAWAANITRKQGSRFFLGSSRQENSFDVSYRDSDSLQEHRLSLRTTLRECLKLWVTGLEVLVAEHKEQMTGLNVDAMSRTMFKKADKSGDGKMDLEEVCKLLQMLGMAVTGGVAWQCELYFKKYDQDNDGTLGEDEFVALFESLMVKKVLRDHFRSHCRRVPVGGRQCDHHRPSQISQQSADSAAMAGLSSKKTNGEALRGDSGIMPAISFVSDREEGGSTPLQGGGARNAVFPDDLCRFLREVQREDTATEQVALETIQALGRQPGAGRAVIARCSALTEIGFSLLLCSDRNMLIDAEKAKLTQDMSLPLSRYWINSSHNTYLEGKQIAGSASVAQYIEVFSRGCRCVEIDVWDGKDGQPVVTHAYMSRPWIPFEDVVRACRDHAFQKTTSPLIISLEQHCCNEQKVRCAEIFSETLDDMLMRLPEGIDFKEVPLTSPDGATGKVIVKASPAHIPTGSDTELDEEESDGDEKNEEDTFPRTPSMESPSLAIDGSNTNLNRGGSATSQKSVESKPPDMPSVHFAVDNSPQRAESKLSAVKSIFKRSTKKTITQSQKRLAKGLAEYNRCIYLQAKRFKDDHLTDTEARAPCNCASFRESNMRDKIQAHGPALNGYHQDKLSRLYPGLHLPNVRPMMGWLHGVQMVALNFQNIDEAMLLNEGFFRHQGGGTGYVQKPPAVNGAACLCSKGHRMSWTKAAGTWTCSGDEVLCALSAGNSAESNASNAVPTAMGYYRCTECDFSLCEGCAAAQIARQPVQQGGVKPLTLRLRLLSGHHFPKPQKARTQVLRVSGSRERTSDQTSQISPFTRVSIHGLDSDCSTATSQVCVGNGFDPSWDESFHFSISRPDVAILTFQVYNDVCKSLVVAAAYPVSMLREGIRWAPMWDYRLRALEHCGLLVEIRLERTEDTAESACHTMELAAAREHHTKLAGDPPVVLAAPKEGRRDDAQLTARSVNKAVPDERLVRAASGVQDKLGEEELGRSPPSLRPPEVPESHTVLPVKFSL